MGHTWPSSSGIVLWGTGLAATVVVNQQTLLLTGHKAPETATSIGVLLARAGFAVGATVGGLTIEFVGVPAVPVVALVFVAASICIATTLGHIVDHSAVPRPRACLQIHGRKRAAVYGGTQGDGGRS